MIATAREIAVRVRGDRMHRGITRIGVGRRPIDENIGGDQIVAPAKIRSAVIGDRGKGRIDAGRAKLAKGSAANRVLVEHEELGHAFADVEVAIGRGIIIARGQVDALDGQVQDVGLVVILQAVDRRR